MNALHPSRLATALFSCLFLVTATACQVGPPTADELTKADYGMPITQKDAEGKAIAWIETVLRDPESLRASWEPVKQGWQRDFGGDLFFGYRMGASVNAKNGFGGYTGAQPYVFMFMDGSLVHVWKPTEGGLFMTKVK